MPSFRRLLYTLSTLALLLFLVWAALREPVQLVSTQKAHYAALTQSFTEEGKTRIRQRYLITAPVVGTLQRIDLEPGDAVAAGQVLARIEPITSSLLDARSRAQAEAEIRAGQSQHAAARQRLIATRAANTLAQTHLQRAQALHQRGTISREMLDQAETRASTTAAELAAAQADEQTAIQRVNVARAVLAQEGHAGADAEPLPVTAPVDGVLLRRILQSTTPVSAGQALLEIGDTTQLEIESEVLSTDAVRLSPGMAVRVVRWGGDGVLEARINRIEPGGYTKISALGVEEQRTRVIIDITSPHAQWAALGDAYRVELEFIVQHEEHALQVPAGALFRSASSTDSGSDARNQEWALYRVIEGRARRTPVRIGLRASTAVQILEGLDEGDVVIVQPDDRIHDGSRVE